MHARVSKTTNLNEQAGRVADVLAFMPDDFRVAVHRTGSARLIDCGINVSGGLAAGMALARCCMSDLGDVSLVPGDGDSAGLPRVFVQTDHPVDACLFSQYAGWRISVGKFFAMGSGPMRSVVKTEPLFEKLTCDELAESLVGVLETSSLPDEAVVRYVSEKSGIPPEAITLLVAPTASQAGTLQVVARSVETALHKLFELKFDVTRIESGLGAAPLAPVAADDLTAIGRTNDAILYGGHVTLWVRGDDESIERIGPMVPSSASHSYGKPFLELFEDAGRDFYKIDPLLFSPAEIVFHNLDTGRVFHFGAMRPVVLRQSFGC